MRQKLLRTPSLEPEHFRGHDCRNWGHTIANLELRTERHWP